MLFQSPAFLVFFVLYLLGLPILKGKSRMIYSLIASYIFYGWWYPPYALVLVGLTLLSYTLAFVKNQNGFATALIVGCTLLPLCFFKYLVFFANTFVQLLGFDWTLSQKWRLPLGISFITFTVIAYLVDVRRRKFPAEKDFFRYALYVAFFPHLIAGPIVRPKQLLPQLDNISLRRRMIKLGLLLFSVGYVKKVLFADQIALVVDQIYEKTAGVNLLESLFAFYGFPAQIYCDFSGYTDMALGCAFIAGVRLPLNFKRPFIAHSIQNFWRRWHITLSTWLRDYLYIPLGGNRGSYAMTIRNLMMTMLLGGLWHGASWTFVLWGALHGIFLTAEYVFRNISWSPDFRIFYKIPKIIDGGEPFPATALCLEKPVNLKNKIPKWVFQLWTFHLVAASFILFRAKGLEQVAHLGEGFFAGAGQSQILSVALFQVVLIGIFYLTHQWDRLSLVYVWSKRLPGIVILTIVLVLILTTGMLSVGNSNAFLYFDF